MSFQFGTWNFDGQPVDPNLVDGILRLTEKYGFDGRETYSVPGLTMLYRPFHNTSGSRHEQQPFSSLLGNVMTWDGRLDNRQELTKRFPVALSCPTSDIAVTAAAYDTVGTSVLGNLIGDWALATWSAREQALFLAKDPVGTRSLYFALEAKNVTWCTFLEPLVFLKKGFPELNREYIAGYLLSCPPAHLTPYAGIDSVPPGYFVRIERTRTSNHRFWSFDPDQKIRYRSDLDYEEHFRTVFSESVKRRLRTDSPVFAELSGGMDSSSIVCVADQLIARGEVEAPRLDTISYFDDSEPNWDERTYFTKVEQTRGRTGFHINVQGLCPFAIEGQTQEFSALPGTHAVHSAVGKRFFEVMKLQGTRSLLSGFGGDEVLGGVPSPMAELGDLFVQMRFVLLAGKLRAWSLAKREPWLHLLLQTLRLFSPNFIAPQRGPGVSPWLCAHFAERNRSLLPRKAQFSLFGALPSYQDNLSTFVALQRQIACHAPSGIPWYDTLYPMLDRNLLEFLFAIPREQLVRPNERRSLLRRALSGTVPQEILERKRKAYPSRGPRLALLAQCLHLSSDSRGMIAASLGMVDPAQFLDALRAVGQGEPLPILPLTRTLHLEYWLRQLEILGLLRPEHPQPLASPVRERSFTRPRNGVESRPEKIQSLKD